MGFKLFYPQVKYLPKWVLEGLYKSKLQDSVQLQTVLALYEQENIRNRTAELFQIEDIGKATY